MKAKYLCFVLLFLLSFGLDQGTKIWARRTLKPQGYPVYHRNTLIPVKTVIKGFWEFRYSENPGSAFGLFRNMDGARTLLFAVGLVCLIVIGLWLYRVPSNALWLSGKLGLLAGGAVGNIFDRIRFGRVTDFILWQVTTSNGVHQWPTFNIADAALVIGVISILIDWPSDHLTEASSDATTDAAKK
jgi:signal peptidase II